MFLKRLKYFLVQLDFIISKSFFFSQSRLSQILKDQCNFIFNNSLKVSNFKPVKGKIEIKDFKYEIGEEKRADYSYSLLFEKNPDFISRIIDENRSAIENFIGKNFLQDDVMVYRNYKIEKFLSKHDVYSNIWHMDSHDGNRLIRIFVLLSDVTENDGPLFYLDREGTKKNWEKLRERWTFDKKHSDFNYPEQKIMTGNKGDYLLLNTSSCAHRASIPENYRDIMALTLYPSWRNHKKRKSFI
tara:strand:- start:839 stop:1567 length:729 start_codon:yes stop_codon:yes gene_type:complete